MVQYMPPAGMSSRAASPAGCLMTESLTQAPSLKRHPRQKQPGNQSASTCTAACQTWLVSPRSGGAERPSHLLGQVLGRHNGGGADGVGAQHPAPVCAGILVASLADSQGDEVVDEAAAEDPVTAGRGGGEPERGQDLDGGAGGDVLGVGDGGVVEDVEDANAGKRLCDNVGEDGRGGFCVHRRNLGGDVEELGEGVYDDEDICSLEV